MVEDILLEIAIFVFIMVVIGIVLTVFEFKKYVIEEDEDGKKPKEKYSARLRK